MQPPVNGTGLNGTGSAYPRIIVHKCLCCFLLAAGSRGCRGRPRARINAISLGTRASAGLDTRGGGSQSQSPTLNQRQCKVWGVRPYTQMFDSVEGRCP